MTPVRPPRLRPGDTVAVVAPSWGGPAAFPAVFDGGLDVLRGLGLAVREYPATRAAAASVEARVADLHAAFADPDVRAVIAAIGGDDAVRLLPHLDPASLQRDPKIVMGYSDTCALLAWVHHHGVIAFHGPAVMAGFAQARGYPPEYLDGLRAVLFDTRAPHPYPSFEHAIDGYADWSDAGNATRTRPPQPARPMRTLQGDGRRRGRLWGGCLEVLEMLKGTPWWPAPGALDGAVLLLEGSEEAPPPTLYRRVLRSWAAAGHLRHAAALLVGRPARYDAARRAELDVALIAAVAEAGRPDLPVLVDACFGHTDPQWVLPLGGVVEVDADRGALALVEPAVR